MLHCKNISHKFEFPLFDDISLDFAPSSTSAITGTSGSGKSTILHILSTLLKPNGGEVFYKNRSLYTLSTDELLKIRRYDFGIIFQQHYLFRGFSALENVELATILSEKELDRELFDALGIAHILSQKVGRLSGGQQQRVSIARVLSKRPKVIFADEPTGNLDKNTAGEVMGVIFDYVKRHEAALVLVTHDETLASSCQRRFHLSEQVLREVSQEVRDA